MSVNTRTSKTSTQDDEDYGSRSDVFMRASKGQSAEVPLAAGLRGSFEVLQDQESVTFVFDIGSVLIAHYEPQSRTVSSVPSGGF